MSYHDDLSRLLDGELDEAERAELQARIASDPEVRAAWELLQSLPARFDTIRAVPPPPGLDERVLAPTGRPWPSLRGVAPWALLAATVAIAVSSRQEPVEIEVRAGTDEIQGVARVHAADVAVDVDGRVRISVEPPDPSVRVTSAGGGSMKLGHPVSAAVGAVVTIAVIEGSAVVRAADGSPSVLSAGQATTIGHPTAPSPAVVSAPTDPASRISALETENALLRSTVDQMDAEWHGTPIPWPADLPEALTPQGFQRNVRDAVESCAPDVEIVGFDCGEPPCLVELRAHGDWWDDLVNNCPTWTGAYTSSVASASGEATCPDGRTERYNLLGWSMNLAEPAGGFTKEEQENQGKRFEARADEIRRSWRCR